MHPYAGNRFALIFVSVCLRLQVIQKRSSISPWYRLRSLEIDCMARNWKIVSLISLRDNRRLFFVVGRISSSSFWPGNSGRQRDVVPGCNNMIHRVLTLSISSDGVMKEAKHQQLDQQAKEDEISYPLKRKLGRHGLDAVFGSRDNQLKPVLDRPKIQSIELPSLGYTKFPVLIAGKYTSDKPEGT